MTTTPRVGRPVTPSTRPDARPLVWFFVLAYAISWAWAIPMAINDQIVSRGDGWPTHYPALVGPLIAAFVVTAMSTGRSGVHDLVRRMGRWRVGIRWWLLALSPIIFLLVALGAMAALGRELPAVSDFGRFSGTPALGLVGVLLMVALIGALGEETGWRGYALPQLQLPFSPLTATFILAPAWFLWHLPQFFVIATYRDFTQMEYVGMFLGLSAGAVVLTRLYNGSGGSILLVTVWHGVYNMVGATQGATGTIAAVISTLILVQGIVLVVLEVRASRHGRPSILGGGRAFGTESDS